MKNITRATLALSVLGLVGAAALPVHAADTCTDKLTSVKAEIDKAADANKKEAADAHYKQAESAMKEKNEQKCLKHLGRAEAALE